MKAWSAAGLAVALLLAGAARAEDAVIPLPERDHSALVREVLRVRARDARGFARVAAVRAWLAARGTIPRLSVTLQLKGLGRSALIPMLEALALGGPTAGDLSPRATLSWRVGLIEAVGMLRDGRARPVFEAILVARPAEYEIDRAAAEALARLGDDAAAQTLLGLLGGAKEPAVLAGLGDCRRAAVANELERRLAARPDADTARRLILALRDVGNAWAWQTPTVQASGEETLVRPVAARALVAAFVAYDGELRRLAGRALLVVADPSTPELVRTAQRSADPALRADLERLAHKLERNPIR